MWRYNIIWVWLLYTASVSAQSEERELRYDYAHRSDIIVAAQLLQADTLALTKISWPAYTLSAADFISSRVHDSLLRAYNRNYYRDDSLRKAKAKVQAKAKEQAAIKAARRQHERIPLSVPIPEEAYTAVAALTTIYRYNIRVNEILEKRSDTNIHNSYMQLRRGDTITVLIPQGRYGSKALSKHNRYCVVYFKESEYYKSDQLSKMFKTPELEAYYRKSKTFWLDTGRAEQDIWKPVIWQK
jgi:hypothetical protein